MTTPQADRPPRTRPRPAEDAGVDPIDYGTRAAPAPAPTVPVEGKGALAPAAAPERPAAADRVATTAPQVTGGVEPTVQLATRISLDVNDVLTKAQQRTGKKKRALIEEAILRTWS
ncbi:hypothetical protein OR221_3209 [Microbacterium laevaniformans OR221]|nr:hypothetical protein OR221_3209 [Microbacterium laevaniformans OR221]